MRVLDGFEVSAASNDVPIATFVGYHGSEGCGQRGGNYGGERWEGAERMDAAPIPISDNHQIKRVSS